MGNVLNTWLYLHQVTKKMLRDHDRRFVVTKAQRKACVRTKATLCACECFCYKGQANCRTILIIRYNSLHDTFHRQGPNATESSFGALYFATNLPLHDFACPCKKMSDFTWEECWCHVRQCQLVSALRFVLRKQSTRCRHPAASDST